MIVDTEANGTVISQQMATAVNLVPVDKIVASTVSDPEVEFPVAYLISIGGSELENGLIGHGFFKDYDVTLKQDIVEFRVR